MNRIAPLALLLALCAGCSRDEPAAGTGTVASPSTAPPPAAPAPAPAAPAVAPAAPADPSAPFDAGAFSGTFAGSGLRLELRADGTYGLEAPEGPSQGSWTHEAATGSIRLDPGSKSAQDRVFRMADRDTLADGATTLTRQASP